MTKNNQTALLLIEQQMDVLNNIETFTQMDYRPNLIQAKNKHKIKELTVADIKRMRPRTSRRIDNLMNHCKNLLLNSIQLENQVNC